MNIIAPHGTTLVACYQYYGNAWEYSCGLLSIVWHRMGLLL